MFIKNCFDKFSKLYSFVNICLIVRSTHENNGNANQNNNTSCFIEISFCIFENIFIYLRKISEQTNNSNNKKLIPNRRICSTYSNVWYFNIYFESWMTEIGKKCASNSNLKMVHITKSKSRENGTFVILTRLESSIALPSFHDYRFGTYFQHAVFTVL